MPNPPGNYRLRTAALLLGCAAAATSLVLTPAANAAMACRQLPFGFIRDQSDFGTFYSTGNALVASTATTCTYEADFFFVGGDIAQFIGHGTFDLPAI